MNNNLDLFGEKVVPPINLREWAKLGKDERVAWHGKRRIYEREARKAINKKIAYEFKAALQRSMKMEDSKS